MEKVKKGRLQKAKELKDARAIMLRAMISRGRVASASLPRLYEALRAMDAYEMTNRVSGLDKADADEDTADTLRAKIENAQTDVANADKAATELKEIERFYRAYHIVMNMPRLKDLRARLNVAKYWTEQWQERINSLALESDMDIDEQFQEKDYLEQEYAKAIDQVNQIQSQINEITNGKHM